MKKKRKKKQPAKISQHEDAALKVTAQFFRDEIMPVLNIAGRFATIGTKSVNERTDVSEGTSIGCV